MKETQTGLENTVNKIVDSPSLPKVDWKASKQEIKKRLEAVTYQTWIASMELVEISLKDITLSVPSSFHSDFIAEHFDEIIRNSVYQTSGKDFSIQYKIVEKQKESSANIPPKPQPKLVPNNEKPISRRSANILPGFSFDRFIKGHSNKEAFVAAKMLAEDSEKLKANPLIIYGSTGMGKTHLLHAIGNRLIGRNPHKKVHYIPAIQLTYDLRDSALSSSRSSGVPNVFNKYRHYDILLIDDIQYITNKAKTEQLFFNILEAMRNRNAQIVITSDKKPSEIPDLNKRLLSRFQSGLLVEVGLPTHKMKVNILRKKAEINGLLAIEEQVFDLIASCPSDNVRELEGHFIKVMAYSSFKHQKISAELVQKVLGKQIRDKYISVKIPDIISAVAADFELDKKAILSSSRNKEIIFPRQIAMFLAKLHTSDSLESIGEVFGKNHSTVLHSISKIKEMVFTNSSLLIRIKEIEKTLGKN